MRSLLLALLVRLAFSGEDVMIGPFGPVSKHADSKLFERLRRDSLGPPRSAASARVSTPTGLLIVGDRLFASEFRRNQVLVAKTARAARDSAGGPGGAGAWRVFADQGPHCAEDRVTGVVECARLDGAWGLAAHGKLVFVSSFGSDEILAFHSRTGAFRYALSGDVDSPEGLAVSGKTLIAASFLDSRLVAFDLDTRTSRTLSLGSPVEVDFEAFAFVDGAQPFDEAATRDARDAEIALWGDLSGATADTADDPPPYVDRLKGPEQLALIGNSSLAVSSLHNNSVLEIDLRTGRLLSVLADGTADQRFAGPLGVAVASRGDARIADASATDGCDGHASSEALVLVAAYRSDAVSVLRRRCASPATLNLDDDLLRGPTAIALDATDPGGIYVSAYEASAVLYFNLSHVPTMDFLAERRKQRVAARLE